MKRREFITLLGGAAAWPLAAHAQQAVVPVVGFLHPASSATTAPSVSAFRQGLSGTGYVDGRNVSIEFRWAEGQYDRLPALAADLATHKVAVIATGGGSAPALAAKGATSTIPIVFQLAADPVEVGLVASLNRPGGNVTGVNRMGAELVSKRLDLLRAVVPTSMLMAAIINPHNPTSESQSSDLQDAARALGWQIRILKVGNAHDIDAAFQTLAQLRVGALLIGSDPFFNSQSEHLAALSLRYGVPTIHQVRDFAVAGGLMSYAASLTDSYRQVGVYVGRILKGEKPADIPVTQPTQFELTINLKTAKALGLTVPPSLLAIADEVIE